MSLEWTLFYYLLAELTCKLLSAINLPLSCSYAQDETQDESSCAQSQACQKGEEADQEEGFGANEAPSQGSQGPPGIQARQETSQACQAPQAQEAEGRQEAQET
jgi:hypothetical protein